MRFALALALLVLTSPLQAETLSQEIGRTGLAATQSRLALLSAPTDTDLFALGGVTFLRAIEGTFQDRYTLGLTDRTGLLPLLRMPVPDNPAPAAFDPAAITALFAQAAETLTAAQTHLAAIPQTSDFTLDITLTDLWFDVDQSATRSPGEGLTEIIAATLGPDGQGISVRFDVADAAWLGAYCHLLTGISQMVQAYDPTEPIARILQARSTMAELGPVPPDFIFGSQTVPDSIDSIAIVLASLNQAPDRALMASAYQHFVSMISLNRDFWARVAMETDNMQEWLPNDGQTAALGITLPQGTGAAWLAVLAELDAALAGEKLVPYWRAGPPAGVNVKSLFTDPRPVDLAGWLQGWAALPYLEKGPLLSSESLDAFDALTSGQAPLFALYLN